MSNAWIVLSKDMVAELALGCAPIRGSLVLRLAHFAGLWQLISAWTRYNGVIFAKADALVDKSWRSVSSSRRTRLRESLV